MEIKNKVAWITGGASGLGAATAKKLIENGAKVLISDINAELGESYAKELGENAIFVKTNVTKTEENQAALQMALDKWGKIDILINSAGVGGREGYILSPEGMSNLDVFMSVIEINLKGTYDCLRLAANAMQNNEPNDDDERGVIINVSSAFYREVIMGVGSYGASKAAVHHLTKIAALELGKFGIRVVAIAPGAFDTPILETGNDELTANTKFLFMNAASFPKRLGNPPEFAMLAELIIKNTYLNGTTIEIDGGWHLGNWGTLEMFQQ